MYGFKLHHCHYHECITWWIVSRKCQSPNDTSEFQNMSEKQIFKLMLWISTNWFEAALKIITYNNKDK